MFLRGVAKILSFDRKLPKNHECFSEQKTFSFEISEEKISD
jgi:hypothetical protein